MENHSAWGLSSMSISINMEVDSSLKERERKKSHVTDIAVYGKLKPSD